MSAGRFERAVENGLGWLTAVSTGACPGCTDCGLADVEDADDPRVDAAGEGSFSWRWCECCGSTLGGDRYPVHGLDEDEELVHVDACIDCVAYIANGTVPEEWQDGGPNWRG